MKKAHNSSPNQAQKAGKIPQQLKSLVVAFIVLVAVFLVLRQIFIPDTFGELGHFRAAAIDSAKVLPFKYAGVSACLECHDDIFSVKDESYHRTVSCEACHGPAADHAENPDEYVPEAPRDRGYCALCHEYNLSRPTGFPQIDPNLHHPPQPCISCHDPHDPKPSRTPEQCSACHADIYRIKSVSHHAPLDCIRCHQTPDAHRQQPKLTPSAKPTSNKLCGECHASGSAGPDLIPRINMDKHGVGYDCWQCHYPHYPEVQ